MIHSIAYYFFKSCSHRCVFYRKYPLLLFFMLLAGIAGYSQSYLAGNFINTANRYAKDTGSNYVYLGDTIAANHSKGDSSMRGDNELPYDEINVTLNVERIGSLEIPVIIYWQDAYLPVKDIFDFLKIKIDNTPGFDSLSGFFISPSAAYLIDQPRHQVLYQNKIFVLDTMAMIRTETNLYLRSDYFGKIFGLDCIFNYRSLSITLTTKIELPIIREMQQELLRHNLRRLKGERKVDTTIHAGFSLFNAGMADWFVMHVTDGVTADYTRLNLALGAVIAGGEANVSLNYNSNEPFTERDQYYSWKYVNNDNHVIRQLTAGKLYVPSVSSVFSPLRGIQVSNTPSTYRRSFGTYRLSDNTEPGWLVELYVNNVLVNYMKADASGFFSFDVPMVYGNSVVRLRFYGPWGEEKTRDQNISIPFNFLPVNQLEYSLTAGIVDDDQKDKFSRATLNYGLSRHITIGGGTEYLTSANAGKIMPFANVSMRIGSNLLLSGERMDNVRTKGIITYRLPSNLQFDLNYVKYDKAQTAVKFNYLEETKATLSMPFRAKKFSAFSRLTYDQFTTGNEKITTSEFLLSSVIAGMSSNFTTYALFRQKTQPYVYSSFSMTFRFWKGVRLTPQLQYEYREKNFSMLKLEVEKNISNRGFVNLSYQKDMISNGRYISAGLRYNLSFAQTFFSASKNSTSLANKITSTLTTTQGARGSFIFDDQSRNIIADNQSNIGKGGLLFSPFLDLNCNGRRDANEPRVSGLRLSVNGGRIQPNKKDSTIRVLGLEAYTSYYVELDKNSFDNIAWQIKKATMSIAIEPDHLRLIEVAVAVLGEVSGTVYLQNENGKNGLGRIIVNIYNSDTVLVAKTLTEQDGYFSYLGLAPGNYTATADWTQLKNLKMKASADITFTIVSNREGDVKDGLEFILQNEKGRTH